MSGAALHRACLTSELSPDLLLLVEVRADFLASTCLYMVSDTTEVNLDGALKVLYFNFSVFGLSIDGDWVLGRVDVDINNVTSHISILEQFNVPDSL